MKTEHTPRTFRELYGALSPEQKKTLLQMDVVTVVKKPEKDSRKSRS